MSDTHPDTPPDAQPAWLDGKRKREAEAEAPLAPVKNPGCMRIGWTEDGLVMLRGFPFDQHYTLTFTAEEARRLGKGLVNASKQAQKGNPQ